MSLNVGMNIAPASLYVKTEEGIDTIQTSEYFGDRRIVVFVVPGAYTPTCSARHLPGFLEQCDKFFAAGIDAIACLSVNDPFVMEAWGKGLGATGKIDMLADSQAEFSRALGIVTDMGAMLGERAQRCAFVADQGMVTHVFIEEPGAFEVSSAEHVLEAITK